MEAETIERMEALRRDDGSHDEIINEIINIYEAEGLTLFHGGDEYA